MIFFPSVLSHRKKKEDLYLFSTYLGTWLDTLVIIITTLGGGQELQDTRKWEDRQQGHLARPPMMEPPIFAAFQKRI